MAEVYCWPLVAPTSHIVTVCNVNYFWGVKKLHIKIMISMETAHHLKSTLHWIIHGDIDSKMAQPGLLSWRVIKCMWLTSILRQWGSNAFRFCWKSLLELPLPMLVKKMYINSYISLAENLHYQIIISFKKTNMSTSFILEQVTRVTSCGWDTCFRMWWSNPIWIASGIWVFFMQDSERAKFQGRD